MSSAFLPVVLAPLDLSCSLRSFRVMFVAMIKFELSHSSFASGYYSFTMLFTTVSLISRLNFIDPETSHRY